MLDSFMEMMFSQFMSQLARTNPASFPAPQPVPNLGMSILPTGGDAGLEVLQNIGHGGPPGAVLACNVSPFPQ